MSAIPPKDLNGISRQNRGIYVKPKNMKGVIGRLWRITELAAPQPMHLFSLTF